MMSLPFRNLVFTGVSVDSYAGKVYYTTNDPSSVFGAISWSYASDVSVLV